MCAGALVVALSAYAAFHLVPASLGPDAGASQAVTERVDYWTPEEGEEQFLRPRTDRVRETGDGLQLVRRLEGPHSPRGGQFEVDLGERWRLAEEPAAHASFPPTPLWEKPPKTVYVGVPWETTDGVKVATFDDFHRMKEVQRGDTSLVKYVADEPNQFLVDDDVVLFRSAQRAAFVEPISGTVVDYRTQETLWRAPLEGPPILGELNSARERKEKVWEATIEPTPSGQQQLLEQAKASRGDQLEKLLALGVPGLLAGELFLWAGIVGRPRRWLGPA